MQGNHLILLDKKYSQYTHLTYDELSTVVYKEGNKARYHLPTMSGLICHYLRIVAAYIQLSCFDQVLTNEEVLLFGHKLKDPNKPSSLQNTVFDFNVKQNHVRLCDATLKNGNKCQCKASRGTKCGRHALKK